MDALKIREMLKQVYTKHAFVDIREQSLKNTRLFSKAKIRSVQGNIVEIEVENELFRIKCDNIISLHIHDNLVTFDDDYEVFSSVFTVADLKRLLSEMQLPIKDEQISILLNDRRFDLLREKLQSIVIENIKETILQVNG